MKRHGPFLYAAYPSAGWTEERIDRVLKLEIPDQEYFPGRGIFGNDHGGGNVLFEGETILPSRNGSLHI